MDFLDKELAFFASQKDELLKHYENKYVLIKDEKLIDFFSTFEEAYRDGINRFGTEIFLIKKVSRIEEQARIPAWALGIIHVDL